MNNLRFALRMLLKSPGFTAVAVLTLALGIGANTTMFTAVNAILLRPLPYPQPDRLVEILEAARQESPSVVAYPDFLDWQQQTKGFADMAAYQLATFNLTGADEPERVPGLRITANFFRTLGVKPVLGRDFLAEEDEPGGSAVLLLSHRLWERRFGATRRWSGARSHSMGAGTWWWACCHRAWWPTKRRRRLFPWAQ